MDWLREFEAVAGLLTLRCGLPLLLTLLVGYGLSRLDARWQREAAGMAAAAGAARAKVE